MHKNVFFSSFNLFRVDPQNTRAIKNPTHGLTLYNVQTPPREFWRASEVIQFCAFFLLKNYTKKTFLK